MKVEKILELFIQTALHFAGIARKALIDHKQEEQKEILNKK
jgi:hypothetical protein